MLRIIITIVIVCTSLSIAAPPDIACLSGFSVTEAFEQKKHTGPKNIIFIVSDGGFAAESWSRSIWNDPEFVEHLKKSGIIVAYMDRESDPVLHEILQISSTPTFVFYHDSILTRLKGLAHASDESRASHIEWIDAARMGTTRSRQMQRQLDEDSTNIELRFELLKELNREGREADSLDYFYWLFDHNELFYQFTLDQDRKDREGQDEIENPEMSFRAMLIWFINGPRDTLGLYKEKKSNTDGYPPRDGWARAIKLVDEDRVNTESDRKIEVLVKLRRALEARRDNNSATERDLFILKVLTAEGEEWQQLGKEYQPYFK